ncbi:NlpC/P60 family protein [Paenibacillus sp. KQZ6P-2]|uniref:NlpC/P60 family protein n=1 Tax=Paenibacillus mangrovi TaxID=2931978 RepID=A0A9X1WQH2_9BACL|nr:NlpC/P60 family protein [Paenibacillus mangrovi]MCJ8013522.1 NlpC/P60 family protein [Paenibacillus mangrovi]
MPAGSVLLPTSSVYAASATTADQIIATGKQYLGVPYKYGSKSGDTSTFDCSSFTQYIFKQNGYFAPTFFQRTIYRRHIRAKGSVTARRVIPTNGQAAPKSDSTNQAMFLIIKTHGQQSHRNQGHRSENRD